MSTIAADPKHLGAKIGVTSVLHSWGSALTHHPHVHMIVPGGGISPDAQRWVSCRPGFFLPVRVLSLLFQRLFPEKLATAHDAGRLRFFGAHARLAEPGAFAAYLAPLRKIKWVVYAKRSFGGPEAVLACLSRYTHRVAIANSRLIVLDDRGVTFKWRDYRAKGPDRRKVMILATHEFIRRFFLHVLPQGFHRIRHGACPGLDPGDCLPTAGAQKTWPGPETCSKRRRPKTRPNPSHQPMTGLIRSPPPASVAADPWSSSRPSSPATRPAPRHQPRATAHDTHHIKKLESCLPLPTATCLRRSEAPASRRQAAPPCSRTSRPRGSANKSLSRHRQGVETPPRRPHRCPESRDPTDPATRHSQPAAVKSP